jgi:hypothetical protein
VLTKEKQMYEVAKIKQFALENSIASEVKAFKRQTFVQF